MGSSISDERLDANTLQPTQLEANKRQAQQLDATQLDAIVAAYVAADAACGRKPGPQPQQPERLLTPDERYAFFRGVAPELHAPTYERERYILLNTTHDNVKALDPSAPMFELLTHANLTLCGLFGIDKDSVQHDIDTYHDHVVANRDASHFNYNVHTNGDEPQTASTRRYKSYDLLLLFCGESQTKAGKIQFSLDAKASIIRFFHPIGRYVNRTLPLLVSAISERYRRWTVEPESAPSPINELQWLSYMAAVSIGSTLDPSLDTDGMHLAPYLVDESDFMHHASGRCFARNFKIDPEKTERREQMEQGAQQ